MPASEQEPEDVSLPPIDLDEWRRVIAEQRQPTETAEPGLTPAPDLKRGLVTILPPGGERIPSDPFTLGVVLTIADAALLHRDRHPRPAYWFGTKEIPWGKGKGLPNPSPFNPYEPAGIAEIESMIGRGATRDVLIAGDADEPARGHGLADWVKSWSVYCTLVDGVERGTTPAIRPVYQKEGKINGILTEISVSVVFDLARSRGDAGSIFTSLLTWYEDEASPALSQSGGARGGEERTKPDDEEPAVMPTSKVRRGRKPRSGEKDDGATLRGMLRLLAEGTSPSAWAAAGAFANGNTSTQRRFHKKFSAQWGVDPPPDETWNDVLRGIEPELNSK